MYAAQDPCFTTFFVCALLHALRSEHSTLPPRDVSVHVTTQMLRLRGCFSKRMCFGLCQRKKSLILNMKFSYTNRCGTRKVHLPSTNLRHFWWYTSQANDRIHVFFHSERGALACEPITQYVFPALLSYWIHAISFVVFHKDHSVSLIRLSVLQHLKSFSAENYMVNADFENRTFSEHKPQGVM